MARHHKLAEGQSLPSIAAEHGFRSWRTIYFAPENAKLRARQPNPNLLAPGDVVVIPDRETRFEPAHTGARHSFVARRSNTVIRLKLLLDHRVDFELSVEGQVMQAGSTDGSRPIEQRVSPEARSGRLTIWHEGTEPRTEATGFSMELDIGLLGSVDQLRGVDARLRNLDFLHGELASFGDESPERQEAIKRFERSSGRPPVGLVDDSLRALLLAHHDEV